MSRHLNYPEFLQESLKKSKHSIIHVKNLSGNARVGVDVWGRTENGKVNKYQPVLISASISLEKEFESAASSDSVDGSTVHYGILSKEILKVLSLRGEDISRANGGERNPECKAIIPMDWSLTVFLDATYSWISERIFSEARFGTKGEVYDRCPDLFLGSTIAPDHPLAGSEDAVELSCFLPKGSILGSGVSLRVFTMAIPEDPIANGHTSAICSILKIHDLRIPTIIGVNANERLAKQMVIANVEIDGYLVYDTDIYHKLEQIVVKTIEESSFETLETLGTHLVKRIITWFIYAESDSFMNPYHPSHPRSSHIDSNESSPQFNQLITITLEKPSAVMFAESPMIEIRRHADPEADPLVVGKDLCVRLGEHDLVKVPFPLQGRLDDWIKKVAPSDSV